MKKTRIPTPNQVTEYTKKQISKDIEKSNKTIIKLKKFVENIDQKLQETNQKIELEIENIKVLEDMQKLLI